MTSDAQLAGPPAELLATARHVVPRWLNRIVRGAVDRSGNEGPIEGFEDDIAAMIDRESAALLDELDSLLRADVDDQRGNPLNLFRRAVIGPNRLLVEWGLEPPHRSSFDRERFPDDLFGLGPANWAEIDPDLHEPGITWGAWKAMTVLRRRRNEGLR